MSSLERSARYAWLVVALLLPVALLNYLDRQMLATMKASSRTACASVSRVLVSSKSRVTV